VFRCLPARKLFEIADPDANTKSNANTCAVTKSNADTAAFREAINHLELADVLITYGNIANPIDAAPYLVRQHYVDFLDREPERRRRFLGEPVLDLRH
jgi:hypothetical protein